MLHRGVGRGVGVNHASRRAHLECPTEFMPTKGTSWVELTIKRAWTYGQLATAQRYDAMEQKATALSADGERGTGTGDRVRGTLFPVPRSPSPVPLQERARLVA